MSRERGGGGGGSHLLSPKWQELVTHGNKAACFLQQVVDVRRERMLARVSENDSLHALLFFITPQSRNPECGSHDRWAFQCVKTSLVTD